MKKLLSFLIIGVLILQSCIKPSDFDMSKMTSPVYNGEWAVPLVTSHITINDILKNQNSLLQVDQQGLVKLFYTIDSKTALTADQLMKIPDQNLSVQNYSFATTNPIIDLSTGKQYAANYTADIPLTLANATQKLDSIYVKSGTIRIPINTNFNKQAIITIQAPNIINKTTRVKITIPPINITPPATNSFVNVDVNNCILILKTVSGVPNTIHFDLSMTMQGNASSTLANYTFNMPLTITSLQFSSLYGNLGQFTTDMSQTVNFSTFNGNLGAGFQFAPGAINLTVNVDNSFGVPVKYTTTTFTAHSDNNTPHDVPINLFVSPNTNTFDVGAPTIFGSTKTTTITSTNPNISDAFNIYPNKIVLVANALTNPSGPGSLNFVSDRSTLTANMNIMLNFFASINNFSFQDTLDYNLTDLSKLESLSFRINTTNGFPLGVKLQVYFTDLNYNVLDAMFADPLPDIMKPAALSGAPDYKTTTPTSYQFPDVLYDQTRLTKIKNTKKIILKIVLNTPSNGLVKIYNSYYFDSKIAVRAKAKISTN
jgi:hypothetical protein